MTERRCVTRRDAPADPYHPIDPTLVVSSGHAFASTATNATPRAALALDRSIARTLAALRDEPLVAVEPHVWKTAHRDLLIRLDGFGPNVPMDPELATAMTVDALDRPGLVGDDKRTVVAALHAIASSGPIDARRVSCSAPMPWRPACMETSDEEIPTCSFWSGAFGRNDTGAWASKTNVPLEPEAASLLPRIVCVEDAVVTLDDRRGMRLRQIAWSGPPHRAMDAMQSLRALADLDATLARHDPDARSPAPPPRTRGRRPAAATTPVVR